MKVSELAKTAGVNPQTVRYYEREGLLDEPARNAAGYRDYDASAVRRLRFILEAKAIGFTLVHLGGSSYDFPGWLVLPLERFGHGSIVVFDEIEDLRV